MKQKSWMCVAALALFAIGPAGAAPISYQGTLIPGSPVTDSVPGTGWADEDGTAVDFWRFFATGGNTIRIVGARLNEALDLALTLYSGLTTADTSEFRNVDSFGGLGYLAFGDDEIEAPGPFGDPHIAAYRATQTGFYTIAVGGSASDDVGPYPYQLVLQVVPVPASALLLGAGLIALGWSRRRDAGQGS